MTTGKGARRWILTAVVMGVVAGVMIYWLWQPEPVYRGHQLSYWLQAYSLGPYSPPINRADADAALDAAGTNAVPTLLRLLAAKDPAWKHGLMALGIKNKFFGVWQTRWLHPTSSLHYNIAAATAFLKLGPGVQKRVPTTAWISIYEDNSSYFSRYFAIKALGDLGSEAKPAIPLLLRVAANTNAIPIMRVEAIETLGRIHAPLESVLPALLQAAHDPDRIVCDAAMDYFGPYGADSKSAVAALIKLLGAPDARLRQSALQLAALLNARWLAETFGSEWPGTQ